MVDDASIDKLVEDLQQVFDDYVKIFIKKQRDYGPGNINAFGLPGVVVRLSDKIQRLRNLYYDGFAIREPPVVSNETVDDTLMDIIGYAAIALLLRRGKWPK